LKNVQVLDDYDVEPAVVQTRIGRKPDARAVGWGIQNRSQKDFGFYRR
jgi:hypothetical protein